MSRRSSLIFLCVLGLVATSCAGRGRQQGGQADIDERFARGLSLFEKERWARAAEDFNWVVLNNPAGNLAAEAQYYYAECLYQQQLYVEAQIEFERLLRRWASTEYLVDARYRIVQSLVAQSPSYYFDQRSTEDAINELQDFIEDFPATPQRAEAEQLIAELRDKMAQKIYESGRLYLKWRRTDPARLYFDTVLTQYYDTPYADEARLGTLVAFIIEEDLAGARNYLDENGVRFQAEELRREAERLLEINRDALQRVDAQALIVNAAGCGAQLGGALWPGDESPAPVDVAEWLAPRLVRPPRSRLTGNFTYDAPCHLLHAQGVRQAPLQLLSAACESLLPLPESELCCGGAGAYTLTQPEMSRQVLSRKIEHVAALSPDVLVTGNPGCQLQLQAGLRLAGLKIPVRHTVQVLDQAYQQDRAYRDAFGLDAEAAQA